MGKILGNIATTPTPRSDWAQTDATKIDFILNKPTKVSEFENDLNYVTDDQLLEIDVTLTESGKAADAKTVGDILAEKLGYNKQELTEDQKAQARENIGAGVPQIQANYAQNDTTAPDYVKNRLAWSESTLVTVIPEMTIPIVNGECSVPYSVGLAAGDTYIVKVNGTEYTCVCSVDHTTIGLYAAFTLGNLSLLGIGADTGEPFIIIDVPFIPSFGCMVNTGDGNYLVSLSKVVDDVHKLDEKFLPKTTWDFIGLEQEEIFNGTVSGFSLLGMLLIPQLQFIDEQEYEVIWDGVSYLTTYNGYLGYDGSTGKKYPFYIEDYLDTNFDANLGTNSGDEERYFTLIRALDFEGNMDNTVNSHTIVIKTHNVINIPEKYLPEIKAEETTISSNLRNKYYLASNAEEAFKKIVEHGVNWHEFKIDTVHNDYIINVIYADDKFVAITRDDYIIYSYDGVTWEKANCPFDISSNSKIRYINNKFFVDGWNHWICSDNGIEWDASTLTNPYDDVAYGNGRYVAVVRNSPQIAYSDDGVTWNVSTIENCTTTGSGEHIIYGNGKFIAYTSGDTIIRYSDDGIVWNEVKINNYVSSIIYFKDKFFLNNPLAGRAYDYSVDGINWELALRDDDGGMIKFVSSGEKIFYCYSKKIYFSDDGITWDYCDCDASNYNAAIAYNGKILIMATSDGHYYSTLSKYNPLGIAMVEDLQELQIQIPVRGTDYWTEADKAEIKSYVDEEIIEVKQFVFDMNNIDYNTLLAFDTSEIVFGTTSTTSVLGQAILGQMVLA